MKRKLVLVTGILVTVACTMSGTYAYYQDSVTVSNHISTGDVNIGIQEYEKTGILKILSGPGRRNSTSFPDYLKDSQNYKLCRDLLYSCQNDLYKRSTGINLCG